MLGPHRLPAAGAGHLLRPGGLPVRAGADRLRRQRLADRAATAGRLRFGRSAFLIGMLVFRRRGESGPYFSMITLALSLLAYQVANNWESVTGGFNGLKGIPGLPGLDSYTAAYYVAAVALVLACLPSPGSIARRSACCGPRSPTTSAGSCCSASTPTG